MRPRDQDKVRGFASPAWTSEYIDDALCPGLGPRPPLRAHDQHRGLPLLSLDSYCVAPPRSQSHAAIRSRKRQLVVDSPPSIPCCLPRAGVPRRARASTVHGEARVLRYLSSCYLAFLVLPRTKRSSKGAWPHVASPAYATSSHRRLHLRRRQGPGSNATQTDDARYDPTYPAAATPGNRACDGNEAGLQRTVLREPRADMTAAPSTGTQRRNTKQKSKRNDSSAASPG